ncbi:hypothetical protein BD311DRAFT_748545 [Dichomitus squalens]|uniref:Uncharacterized protein n=1 Tax=Dichomitus squalens TaxID=114155 RepID=A0A4Q9N3Q9_9APHY|nr:hypothetical protein BD311DRAFT_748545 [Dichomitus squalens]
MNALPSSYSLRFPGLHPWNVTADRPVVIVYIYEALIGVPLCFNAAYSIYTLPIAFPRCWSVPALLNLRGLGVFQICRI